MKDLSLDPAYPLLKAHLIEMSGLAYYSERDQELQTRVKQRMSQLEGTDCRSYLALLQASISEFDIMMAELTIGETYFFRHAEQWDLIKSLVIPDVLDRNKDLRKLHVWCAGCANGAEPYTLSILLQREFGQRLVGWDVAILGSDANRPCLKQAERARYGEWAFRGTPEWLRRECFEESGDSWSLRPQYRRGVSFHFHNLVSQPFVGWSAEATPFDLIICRNVLIYFAGSLSKRLIEQFRQRLRSGGWLVLGHAEGDPHGIPGFRTVPGEGAIVYQERKAEVDRPPEPPPVGALSVAAPLKKAEVPATPGATHLLQAADANDWQRAEELCAQVQSSLEPRVHYCAALIQLHLEQPEKALVCLKRALFLDRNYVLAHYLTGQLQRDRGRIPEATRAFRNAVRILEGLPPKLCLDERDNVSVAELKETIQGHLTLLEVRE